MTHPLLTKLKRHPQGTAPVAVRSFPAGPGVTASTPPGRDDSAGGKPASRPSWSSLRAIMASVQFGGNALDDIERLHDV